ncbi:MAG TPA: J domain-containing protein [Chitinophagaceae bacterium]|jgi:curved DNA-binding protein CbpA
MIKDYYNILEIPSSATLPEIKTAYRKLAMVYHPDKNAGDPYSSSRFDEIKEAYEVLTNPAKKENYLQQRWYQQSIGRKRSAEMVTPVSILRLSLEVEKYVSTLDIHRMDNEGLSAYISELVSANTIEKLKEFNEKDINRQIVSTILAAMSPLPLNLAKPLVNQLSNLVVDDKESQDRIASFLTKLKKNFLWDKYKIVLILLFTIGICFLIYITSR